MEIGIYLPSTTGKRRTRETIGGGVVGWLWKVMSVWRARAG